MNKFRSIVLNSGSMLKELKFIFSLSLILIASFAFAQDDDMLKGQQIFNKPAKIELNPATRNFEKINNIQPAQTHTPLDYKGQDIELILPKLQTKVKVAPLKDSSVISKLYGDYLKVGFGNYTTPYFEGFFNNKRSEKYLYGVHAKHLSSANGPVRNSGQSENQVEVYGKYIGKNTILRGNAGYQRNRYNFYGYDHFLEPNANKDTLKQIFDLFAISAGIENRSKLDRFNYNTDFNFYDFSTYKKAHESEFLWNLKSDYAVDENKKILLDGGLSVSKRSDVTSINRTLFTIKPAFQYTYNEDLVLTGGFNIAYANDTIKDYNKLHVYPKLNVDYKLIDNKLIVFGGFDGDMQKNTLRTFSRENPYLSSEIPLFHTNKLTEFYAGAKGGLKGGVSYKIKASTATYKYLYFFNNSVLDTSKFSVFYDRGNVSVTTLNGELGYELSNKFRLAIAAAYYKYNTTYVEKAWHRPDFTSSILATYNLNKKVYFNADFYYIGGLRGKNYQSGQEVSLKGIADLNLKIDYLFSKRFSAFIEANNILSQKYQRYLYYSNKGINVLAGITYSF